MRCHLLESSSERLQEPHGTTTFCSSTQPCTCLYPSRGHVSVPLRKSNCKEPSSPSAIHQPLDGKHDPKLLHQCTVGGHTSMHGEICPRALRPTSIGRSPRPSSSNRSRRAHNRDSPSKYKVLVVSCEASSSKGPKGMVKHI